MNLQFTLAARYLAGRKLRTALTTLAVVFGVLVIFGMNIILPTMSAALQANAMAAQGVVDLTISHETGDAFPQTELAKVRAVAGVRAAAGSLNRTINLPVDFYDQNRERPDLISVLTLVGIDSYAARMVRSYPLMAGRYLQDGDSASALITQTLADQLAVKVGDQFPLPTVDGVARLTVVGVLPPRLGPGTEQVLVTLAEAQALTAEPGRINTIDVTLDSTDQAGRVEIADRIQSALGQGYSTGPLQGGDEMFTALRVAQLGFSIFGMLALFMGAFIIFNTFRTVVVERRHDIGLLRAIGASRATVTGIIVAEGLLQGVIGTLVGLVLGYLSGAGVLWLAGPLMSQFLNLKMGAPVVSPLILIVSIVLGVGVTVAAGLVPAVRASRVTPLEALSSSAADVDFDRRTGRAFIIGAAFIVLSALALFSDNLLILASGTMLFLLGLVMVAPALVRPVVLVFGKLIGLVYAREGTGELARGNLIHQPSRVAVTASATMLGLAVLVAAGGLITSVTGSLDDMLQKSLGSDYVFVPPSVALWASDVGADANLMQRLRALEGVGDISTLRYAGSVANGQQISVLGIDPVAFPKVAGLHFQQGIETLAYRQLAQGRSMIANGAFLTATGTKVGDDVDLATPTGRVSYHIVAMALDVLNVKITTAYISQANLQTDFDKTEDVFLQLNLKPGVAGAATGTQIRTIAADYPQFQLIAGKTYVGQLKAELDAAFSGVYFILGLLALPSLIAMLNTLAINVIERTREMGTMRAVGATRRQIRTMVVAEALLLASIGSLFGILCGLYLGYLMVSGVAIIYPIGYNFPLVGIFASIAIGLLLGLLAAIIPARQAARMNIVDALRYE